MESSTIPPLDEVETAIKPMFLSVAGLVLGIVALGFAVIPSIAMEKPLANPFAKQEPPPKPPSEPAKGHDSGVTIKYKSVSVTFGGKKSAQDQKKKAAEAEPPPKPELKVTTDPVRWFTMSAIGFALVGLVIAPIAHVKEKHHVLTCSSMVCSVAAITWQYVAVGIAVGIAAAVFVITLKKLAEVCG